MVSFGCIALLCATIFACVVSVWHRARSHVASIIKATHIMYWHARGNHRLAIALGSSACGVLLMFHCCGIWGGLCTLLLLSMLLISFARALSHVASGNIRRPTQSHTPCSPSASSLHSWLYRSPL